MAIQKKSIAQIAKENNINLSEENAQKVADAYIQPTLNAITTAEQNAAASTQTARKSLDNDYFNQYRSTQYNAQSRGLTGGLASLAENRLRAEMAGANTDLTNKYLQQKAELDTQRGTALSNAKTYKTQYLADLLKQVQALREQDYQQRYQEWYNSQQLALQRASLAQQSAANSRIQKLQEQAYADEYAEKNLANIYNTYRSMKNSGNTNGAANYLVQQMNKLKKLGYDTSAITTQFGTIDKYYSLPQQLQNYQNLANAWGKSNNMAFDAKNLIPIYGQIKVGQQKAKAKQNVNYYNDLVTQTQNAINNLVLPSWYTLAQQ